MSVKAKGKGREEREPSEPAAGLTPLNGAWEEGKRAVVELETAVRS